MNEFKIDDTFFKDEIDYKDLDESIYTQFAKTMAKNVDIDLAKTPLVDILTGYTRYRILQSKIDKAIEYINSQKKTISKSQADLFNEGKDNKLKLQVGTFMWNVDELLDILKEEKIDEETVQS